MRNKKIFNPNYNSEIEVKKALQIWHRCNTDECRHLSVLESVIIYASVFHIKD